jgi:hypothetical protein
MSPRRCSSRLTGRPHDAGPHVASRSNSSGRMRFSRTRPARRSSRPKRSRSRRARDRCGCSATRGWTRRRPSTSGTTRSSCSGSRPTRASTSGKPWSRTSSQRSSSSRPVGPRVRPEEGAADLGDPGLGPNPLVARGRPARYTGHPGHPLSPAQVPAGHREGAARARRLTSRLGARCPNVGWKTSFLREKRVRTASVIGGETRGVDRHRRDAKLQVRGYIDLVAPGGETGAIGLENR